MKLKCKFCQMNKEEKPKRKTVAYGVARKHTVQPISRKSLIITFAELHTSLLVDSPRRD
jgi:hypothetical protein